MSDTLAQSPVPTLDDMSTALFELFAGATAASLAEHAADSRFWDLYRTSDGLARISPAASVFYAPGDDLAGSKQDRAARVAAAAAELEAAGWTQDRAVTALRENDGNTWLVLARDGWNSSRSCSDCAPYHRPAGPGLPDCPACPCHTPVSASRPALALVTA